jgi:hypothetical protein
VRVEIRIEPPAWSRRRKRVTVAAAVVAAVALVPLAWASDFFGDVPASNPHHDDVGAIAGAGITTGCGPGAYCPEQAVRRDQMASFMRRGFGRLAYGSLDIAGVPGPPTAIPGWSVAITPGLPAGALPGAAGFLQANAKVNVLLLDETGCPCAFGASLFLEGHGFMDSDDSYVTLRSVGEVGTIPLTGARRITTSGAKVVRVRMWGDGEAVANGDLTATYFPFGATGGNVLGPAPDEGGRGALLERAAELRR